MALILLQASLLERYGHVTASWTPKLLTKLADSSGVVSCREEPLSNYRRCRSFFTTKHNILMMECRVRLGKAAMNLVEHQHKPGLAVNGPMIVPASTLPRRFQEAFHGLRGPNSRLRVHATKPDAVLVTSVRVNVTNILYVHRQRQVPSLNRGFRR